MKALYVATTLMLLAAPAVADTFTTLVGYECDRKNNTLILTYVGAPNEDGERLFENRSPTQWDPYQLIESMIDEDHIGTLKTIEGKCRLKNGTYRIRLGPTPGNYNIQGRCGANIGAWAEVWLGSKLILPRYEFEGDCHDTETPVTTKITIKPRGKKHVIEKTYRGEFQ